MPKILYVSRMNLVMTAVVVGLVAVLGLYLKSEESRAVSGGAGKERTYHMVTGEFKTTTPDGKEIEAYRWDPGTIVVQKGETVHLHILGVNGESHPFMIEGLNIRGEVQKGKETVVSFKADKEGTYRIVCQSHQDIAHQGPMIGYIVVD